MSPRLFFLSVGLVCLLSKPAVGQVPAELRDAMSRRSQAVANADAATWDQFTAEDFTVVLPDGHLMNKAERIARMKTQKPQRRSSPQQEQVKHYDETYVRRFLGDAGWVLEVWTRDGDKWRVSAVQVTPAAKK